MNIYLSTVLTPMTAVIPYYEYSTKSYVELNRTLKSLIGWFTDIIIVVDNPTVHFKNELIPLEYMSKITVVKNTQNLGCLASRIKGWKLARTDYIVNIDSGDVIDKDADFELMWYYSRECIPSLVVAEYEGKKLLGEDISCPKNYMGGSSICGKLYPTHILKDLVNRFPSLERTKINNKEDFVVSILLYCAYPDLKYSRDTFFGKYKYNRSTNSISNYVSYEKIYKENETVLLTLRNCLSETDVLKVQNVLNSNWRHLCKCFVDYEYALEKLGKPSRFPKIRGMRMREFYDSPMTPIEDKTEKVIGSGVVFDGVIHQWWKQLKTYEWI